MGEGDSCKTKQTEKDRNTRESMLKEKEESRKRASFEGQKEKK